MATKPTSLAAQLSENARKDLIASEKENAQVAGRDTPEGKVWVRLQNAHYDADGIYHPALSIALLNEDAVPSSAKVLTAKQVAEAETEE